MLERPTNQAAGLLDLAIQQHPKLMAMVSHGDEQAELPLLFGLCASLVRLGYTVSVLDATVLETAGNPGLSQMLDYRFSPPETDTTPSWSVLPAGLGLQSLASDADGNAHTLREIGRLFPHESVVLVYGNAQLLVPLLRASRVRPVLALSGAKASLLTSYLALKRLLLKGHLEPTIVNVVDNAAVKTRKASSVAPTSLSDCAKYFLNYEVNALDIMVPTVADQPSAPIDRLALGLLETAMALDSLWSMPSTTFSAPTLRIQNPLGRY
jgi:hypothetical protein